MAKNYWLRLQKDFFKRHDIRIVEDMQNGKDYILFYLKLLVESVSHDGELRFSETIPYNAEMLGTITNTNVDIVRSAMKVFMELGMIEMLEDETIYMAEVEKMIGCISEDDPIRRENNRLRQKRHREKIKALRNDNVTDDNELRDDNVSVIRNVELEKEIEIELEIEKELYSTPSAMERVVTHWNEMLSPYGLSEVKAIKSGTKRYTNLNARLKQYGEEQVLQAIDNITLSSFLRGKTGWVITFDWFVLPNNFVKVLEGNYTDREAPEQTKKPQIDWSKYAEQ